MAQSTANVAARGGSIPSSTSTCDFVATNCFKLHRQGLRACNSNALDRHRVAGVLPYIRWLHVAGFASINRHAQDMHLENGEDGMSSLL